MNRPEPTRPRLRVVCNDPEPSWLARQRWLIVLVLDYFVVLAVLLLVERAEHLGPIDTVFSLLGLAWLVYRWRGHSHAHH